MNVQTGTKGRPAKKGKPERQGKSGINEKLSPGTTELKQKSARKAVPVKPGNTSLSSTAGAGQSEATRRGYDYYSDTAAMSSAFIDSVLDY